MPRVPGALRGPGARCRLRGPVRCKASADEPKEASQPSVTVSGTQSKDPAPLPNLTDPVDVVQWVRSSPIIPTRMISFEEQTVGVVGVRV
eukprot:7183209-Pyramimonas_sp.AAC.1